jgi:hypothetical protein
MGFPLPAVLGKLRRRRALWAAGLAVHYPVDALVSCTADEDVSAADAVGQIPSQVRFTRPPPLQFLPALLLASALLMFLDLLSLAAFLELANRALPDLVVLA